VTPPVRIAVVGAGGWGSLLAGTIGAAAGAELSGVADAVAEASRSAADALGTRAFAGIDAALASPDVDAVAIAVPNDCHVALTERALAAGKHVLIEKPMALTIADAERVGRMADERSLLLMPDHIMRFYDPLAEVHRLVSAGAIGSVVAASVSRRDFLHRTKPWLQKRARVGGMLYQSACHEYDLLRWLCGEVVQVRCLAGPLVIAADTLDYSDTILTQLRFESGAVGQVWNCMTDPLMGYDGVVTGSEGTIAFDVYDARVQLRRIGGELEERRFEPAGGWAPWAWIVTGGIGRGEAEALEHLIADFAAAVQGEQPPALSWHDGARAIEIAQAGYLSIAERRDVELPLDPGSQDRLSYLESEQPA
jgi:myo-inositol 2-dehydrogenase / D-chiro-inositol 1-dehydrogenase